MDVYHIKDMDPLLEELRKKLASSFGVTRIDHRFVLRTTIGGVHTEFELVANTINQDVPVCAGCGDVFYGGQNRYKSKTTIQRCVGIQEGEIELCYDCWCPK